MKKGIHPDNYSSCSIQGHVKRGRIYHSFNYQCKRNN